MTHTAKHTPGPLKAVQIIIENSPCTWAVQRKSIREQWGKPSIATYIDNEADARLFAAAPAMYEALVMLLDNMHDKASVTAKWLIQRDTPVNEVIPYLSSHDEIAWYQIIRTALSQAEGRDK